MLALTPTASCMDVVPLCLQRSIEIVGSFHQWGKVVSHEALHLLSDLDTKQCKRTRIALLQQVNHPVCRQLEACDACFITEHVHH